MAIFFTTTIYSNLFKKYDTMDITVLLKELETHTTLEQLEEFFQKYLGKKSTLADQFKQLKTLSPEEKKTVGWKLSETKQILTEAFQAKQALLNKEKINQELEKDIVDISLPWTPSDEGHFSLLAETRREMEELCRNMGFIVEYGTEVVSKFENFESVNIPLSHPATEMHDTIYLEEKDSSGENLILRTHTSSLQNYLIQKYGTPLKVVVPGRCYRFDDMDATHDVMFYQIEGLYIDKNISIAHFKGMMDKLISSILKWKVETRMRPAYFPFVEPGFEIDARYEIKDPKTGEKTMSNWIELLGAGMVHPNVLKTAGLNPDEWNGFAFGLGISRLVAIRNGIKDIRYFTNGDLRFAKSF